MLARKIKGLFRLIRFELPFSAGVCVVMGQLLALGDFAPAFLTVSGFLSIFFVSASILVSNDYFDVETDRINAPDRPIPSGVVTSSETLLLAIVLLILGLVLGYLINPVAFLCTAGLTVIGLLYNRKFKKSGLPGNLMVSFSVGMTFIYGGVSVGSFYNRMAWFFGVIAALIDLGEEIAADAMDAKGDALINSKSLAIRHGKRTALRTSGGIFLLAVLLTIVPFILGWFSAIYAVPVLMMDAAILYPLFRLLKSEGEEGRKYIRWIYLGATSGLLVFILMRYHVTG